jgi:hypothetical protein
MVALKRQQCQLILIALVIAVILSQLSLFHAVINAECSSSFVDTDWEVLTSSPSVVSTSLAFKQSYGLFNDIPDQRWELMRKGAHDEHGYALTNPSSKPKIEHDNPIIEYLSKIEVRSK